MGIRHIEDLPLPEFIKAVRNLETMHASEKLDGANLWMGLDEDGRLFTNRSGKRKGVTNFYSEKDYPGFAAYNGFRAAHAALETRLEDIKRIMQPGMTIELEILFGRQPNAVTYGADDKSYIAFLRGVEGTPNVIADQLTTALGGTSVKVNVPLIETPDGEKLEVVNRDVTYQFTGAQRIPVEKLKDVNLKSRLADLERFLEKPAGLEGSNITNGELLLGSLASIPTAKRDEAKRKKEEITATVISDFKLPIKRELLDNYVNKIKPALGSMDVSPDEDVGIEGVVLRDPTTGDLIKIVDKDVFTTINAFNHAIRNQISGVTKSLDPTTPLETRGGIVGNMKIRIADLLGNAELAKGATAKRALRAVKGETAVDTIKAFTAQLDIHDFLGMKRKLIAIITQGAGELKALLEDFKANKDKFSLKLKGGKTIGISPEIEKRTLLVFAESRRNVLELLEKVKAAKTSAQVVAILYGHLAKQVHNTADAAEIISQNRAPATPTTTTEGLLVEKRIDTDKARYKGKDAYTLMNIYFATIFMAVIMYQANDKKGIRMLKDKTHYRMTSWDKDMSQVNFWGYPIWRSSSPVVKKLIGIKTAQQLFKFVRRAAPSQSRYLHMDLSFGKDVPIEWKDHRKTLRVLQQMDGMNVDRINNLMDGVFNFENLERDQQVKLIGKLFFYVNQFIPSSPLFVRLKVLQDRLILNANGENDHMVQEMKLISEINNLVENDDDASSDTELVNQNVPIVDTVTKARDVNANDGVQSIKKGRLIVRRRRNPELKKMKFPKPKNAAV